MIFQLDVHNWSSKLPQESTDDKLYLSVIPTRLISFISQKMAPTAFGG
jgi:hypothetical protein